MNNQQNHQTQASMQGLASMSKGNQGPLKFGNANYDPQLSQWTWKKSKHHDSWKDVEPQPAPVSLDNLRQELARLQKKDVPIQRTLKEISSDTARASISALVNQENALLWRNNQTLEWKIAGIELDWQSLNRKYRQLKGIDIILRTESRPGMQTNRSKANPGMNGLDPNDIMFIEEPFGRPQEKPFKSQGANAGQNSGPSLKKAQGQDFSMGAKPQFNPAQGPAHGQMGGPPNPPPPPPLFQGQQHTQQGMTGGPAPAHLPQQNQQQQHLQQQQQQQQKQKQQQGNHAQGHAQMNPHQQQGMPMPMPKGPMHPGLQNFQPQPIEVINPQLLKQQKAKPKVVPGQYRSDRESDSDSEVSSIISFSADSSDGYNVVRGRSRSQRRSQSRGRAPQIHQETNPRGRGRSGHDRPPMGKYTNSSPKSKASQPNVQPQQIHIEVNTAAGPTKDHASKKNRSDRYRDEGSDRERRQQERSTIYHGERRGSMHDRSISRSPRQTYARHDKIQRGISPISMTSSVDRGSDSFIIDEASSVYSDEGSVFSQSPRESLAYMSRDRHRTSNEHIHPAMDPRKHRHHSLNEVPELQRRHSRPYHHARRSGGREDWFDDRNTDISWPPAVAPVHDVHRRNSTRPPSVPNPFDTVRYPPQRTQSGNYFAPRPQLQHQLDHAYPPFATPSPPKTLQDAPSRHDSLDMNEVIRAGLESMQEKNRNAFEHIYTTHQRRPLERRNTYDPYDSWSNPQYAGARGNGNGRRLY